MLLLNQKLMIKSRDGNISFFLQFLWKKVFIINLVIVIKVKIFDFEDEKDLEEGWYVVAYAENYLALSNGKPTYVSEDIKWV